MCVKLERLLLLKFSLLCNKIYDRRSLLPCTKFAVLCKSVGLSRFNNPSNPFNKISRVLTTPCPGTATRYPGRVDTCKPSFPAA